MSSRSWRRGRRPALAPHPLEVVLDSCSWHHVLGAPRHSRAESRVLDPCSQYQVQSGERGQRSGRAHVRYLWTGGGGCTQCRGVSTMVSTCIVNFGISFCGTTTSHTQLRRSGPPIQLPWYESPVRRELIRRHVFSRTSRRTGILSSAPFLHGHDIAL